MLVNYFAGEVGIDLLSGFLYAIGVALLCVEAVSPGVGFGTVAGIGCILACIVPDLISGNASGGLFVFMLLGCVLLVLDSRVVGLGPLGWIGMLVLALSLHELSRSVAQFLYTLCGAVALSAAAIPIALSRIPSSKAMQKLTLCESLNGTGMQIREMPDVGAECVVKTVLRPQGLVFVDNETYFANAETDFIAAGERVRVVRINRDTLIVRPLQNEQKTAKEQGECEQDCAVQKD